MGDITVTAANVRPLEGAKVRRLNAGGSLNAGDFVYIASDGDVEAADADAEASAQARGLVIADQFGGTAFVAGQRVAVVVEGPVAGFSGMTPGAVAYISTTAGKIDHTAPATAGDYPFVAGYAESAGVFVVKPQVAVPVVNSGG